MNNKQTTAGTHDHCFCELNTGYSPMCCICHKTFNQIEAETFIPIALEVWPKWGVVNG